MAKEKPGLSEERKERIKDLIDWTKATKGAVRRTSLTHFAENHGVNYDTVKKDLRALSYASKPGPRGFDLRYVPKTYKKDVKKIWGEFKGNREQGFSKREGEIEWLKAKEASNTFLEHHPKQDVERLIELCKPEIKEEEKERLKKTAEEVAEKYQEASEEKAKTRVHPARIYSEVWGKEIGKKIHKELEEALKEMKDASKEEKTEVIRNIWEANLERAKAVKKYQKSLTDYLRTLEKLEAKTPKVKKKRKIPGWMRKWIGMRKGKKPKEVTKKEIQQRIESDYKNLRKYTKPGNISKMPKELKTHLEIMEEFKKGALEEKEKKEKTLKEMLEQSKNIKEANKKYRESKLKERKIEDKLEEIKRKKQQKQRK